MNAVVAQEPVDTQGHFKGIAVVIDDQVHVEDAIKDIVKAIEDAGGHAVRLTELPPDGADLENLTGAAFFILDWNLVELEPGVTLPEGLAQEQLDKKIEFLRKLRGHRHAPVFIFTKEDPDVVEAALRPYEDFYQDGVSSILVRRKSDVGSNVYQVLNNWAKELPSVLALKSWERQNMRAVNSLFNDLHDRDAFWPVFMWKMFQDDSLVPADEMGRLITRLVASRMRAPELDLEAFLSNLDAKFNESHESYRKVLVSLMEGERFLRNDRLDPKSFSTGDVFVKPDDQGKPIYYLNLRAECDCIKHKGRSPGKMHLLRGEEAPDVLNTVDPDYGQVPEKDNEAIIVAMCEGKHIRFKFVKDLIVDGFGTWKTLRIGRLLPPFLTRLLERYAAYSQRPGIPRVPSALLPPKAADAAVDPGAGMVRVIEEAALEPGLPATPPSAANSPAA